MTATSVEKKMRDILARNKATLQQAEEDLAEQGFDARRIEEIKKEATADPVREHKASRRGMSSAEVERLGQMSLFERERRGDFTLMPINPGTEYPLVLTRAPIFPPIRRKTAIRLMDDELSIEFETGWAKARKYGPPLNTYDEDTLLALAGLRQQQISGMGHKLPIQVTNVLSDGETTRVHALYTTVSQVEEYLDKPKGGSGHKRRLESIHRLAAVRILFSRISDKTANRIELKETVPMSLIDVRTVEEGDESFLYIQFPPAMALWLEESVAYIDMRIRSQLTDNGKAIHKHLCGQSRFNISVEKLRIITGTGLPMKRFMVELRATLKKLKGIGWLEYEISGTGRKTPFILTGRRLPLKDRN